MAAHLVYEMPIVPASTLLSLENVREAAERTAPHLHRTPMFSSRSLGERAGVRLELKCESFQKTGSFKPRGALNVVLSLSAEAALLAGKVKLRDGARVVAIVSGGNADPERALALFAPSATDASEVGA